MSTTIRVKVADDYALGLAKRLSAVGAIPESVCVEILVGDRRSLAQVAHNTRRMLQALDAYWLVYEGGGPEKWRHPAGDNLEEHWWGKFELYRGRVQECLHA